MDNTGSKDLLNKLLDFVVKSGASDLFITGGFPPAMKLDGAMRKLGDKNLNESDVLSLIDILHTTKQKAIFSETHESNFAYQAEAGRFRVNVMVQKSRNAIVMRRIPTEISSIDDLNLPQVLKKVATARSGLVLMVGATGSGKSTSLAAMIDYRNRTTESHIITVEDPVEFIHEHQSSIVHQREVGMDTDSWHAALKSALRQAPDVVLIGEIRDRETMEHAISFAETGHLCMATLHANSANQALDRVIHFFPAERKVQLLNDLSLNLKAVISQRLVPTTDGRGRAAAVEILLHTPYIADLIAKGEIESIKDEMEKSNLAGMKTFDQALFDLYDSDRITEEMAARYADSANNVRMNIKLKSKKAKSQDMLNSAETSGLTLLKEEKTGSNLR